MSCVSAVRPRSSFQWPGLRKPARVTPAILMAGLLMAVSPATAADALNFFNNWFVTGDYAVAGVGLRGTGSGGLATAVINMTGVPSQAQPVAAFLYWSTVEASPSPALTDGYFNGNKIRGVVLGSPVNPSCSSSGATIGPLGPWARVYRADVLRYLPVDKNNVRQANGRQTVKLPDFGGSLPNTNGATLVVIYRVAVPGLPILVPLRAVVLYDGAFTMAGNYNPAGMTQTVAGFYQASESNEAKITNIVANGQSGYTSPLSVNGSPLSTRPFVGTLGSRWDNPTFEFSVSSNAASFATKVATGNNQACLTSAAVIASVKVKDSDFDGLLDTWELHGLHRNTQASPATFGGCSDYPNEPCVNLPAMGAVNGKRDIFLQIDWMHGTGDGTGGTDGRGTHDHIPKLEALRDVAAAFAGSFPGSLGIALHFDVGNNYQQVPALPYIVPVAYAQGGSDLDESTLVCVNTAKHTCDYQAPYPVLSFKYGLASVRDGNTLLRTTPHFSQDRMAIFRYVLFAHALGGPYDASGKPIDPITGVSTNTPTSYSGIADRPGGDFMVTLGLWRSQDPANDQVGSAQVQKGTLMHELGHNLTLSHGGLSTQPNCMPNYQSVMNYLYQTRGLTDANNVDVKHIDFSYGLALGDLSENSLNARRFFPPRYRVRYFGPLGPGALPGSDARLHCDGTPIKDGAKASRSEGLAASWPDWSNGTVKPGTPFAFDVNFNGVPAETFDDQPDWFSLNLQQIGSRSNFGALSVGTFGAFATDAGALATDAGALATDAGVFATDAGVFATDAGAFATDGGVFATDGGAFATDGGAFATDAGEFTSVQQAAQGLEPPRTLTATNEPSDIKLTWLPPADGSVQSYDIFRCAGAGCTPDPKAAAFRTGISGATPTAIDTVNDFVDAGGTCPALSTCYNTSYTYAVTANALVLSTITRSPLSNTAGSEVTHLFVIADSKTVTYDGTTQSVTFQIYGDVAGALSAVAVNCSTARNAGSYAINCSGPPTGTLATDAVSYNLAYLNHVPGTLTINRRPITVTAAANIKTYDGTTSAVATPAITLGALGAGDAANFSETYADKNVGTGKTLIPAGSVNDTNGGNNYAVIFVNSGGGVINKAPLTVNATGVNRVYNGTTSASVTLADNRIVGDSLTDGYTSAAFADKNVGTGKVVSAAGITITGTDAGNYTWNTTAATTANITAFPLVVAAAGVSKPYDGTPSATVILSDNRIAGDVFSDTYTGALFTDKNAGAAKAITVTGISITGTDAGNYTFNTTALSAAAISVLPLTVTATGVNKSFDGSANATVTLSDNRIPGAGDTFTDSYTTATFADSNPGTNKTVSVTGISIAGTGAGNYAVTSTTATTSATISDTIDLTTLALNGSPAPPVLNGSTLRLTNNISETTSAWLPAAIPVSSAFTTSFQFRITPITSPPADGFAFVIQAAPTGTATLGTTGLGGYIGYTGIPNSIAIEFDTFSNAEFGDPAGPPVSHIGIQSLGASPNSSNHNTSNLTAPVPVSFSDSALHTATITYDGITLKVFLDTPASGTPVISAPVDLTSLGLNGGKAYAGFTAATGSSSENTDILSWSWN